MKSFMTFALAIVLCGGAYDPKVGTNFASCQWKDRLAEIQAPGDAGGPGDAGTSGDAGPGAGSGDSGGSSGDGCK